MSSTWLNVSCMRAQGPASYSLLGRTYASKDALLGQGAAHLAAQSKTFSVLLRPGENPALMAMLELVAELESTLGPIGAVEQWCMCGPVSPGEALTAMANLSTALMRPV